MGDGCLNGGPPGGQVRQPSTCLQTLTYAVPAVLAIPRRVLSFASAFGGFLKSVAFSG